MFVACLLQYTVMVCKFIKTNSSYISCFCCVKKKNIFVEVLNLAEKLNDEVLNLLGGFN